MEKREPFYTVQLNSVTQLCPTLCDPMDCCMPGLPVHHQLLECTQTHVHWVGDAIQPPHPLLSPSPPAFNVSQYQGLFQWVSSLHQVAKVSEFQLQHQHWSFQWIFRTYFLQDWLVVWYSHLLKNFPQFVVICTVKGFGIINKAAVDVFLEFSCFFYDPADVGNLMYI